MRKSSLSVSMICKKRVKFNFFYFVKLDNVGVSDFLKDLDFSGDSFNVFLVFDLVFLEDLYCHLALEFATA